MKIPNPDFLERTGSENLSARLWRLPPGSANTLHKHVRQEESCFELEGVGRMQKLSVHDRHSLNPCPGRTKRRWRCSLPQLVMDAFARLLITFGESETPLPSSGKGTLQ